LTAALLFSVAMAARMKIETHEYLDDPKESASSVTVCEDAEIWGKIMSSPNVDSIRAIPWHDVKQSIGDYLTDEGQKINDLEQRVAKLKAEIEKKKKTEVSKMMEPNQIQGLIADSVSVEGSYGSLEMAKQTACGRKKPRVSPGALEMAVDSIASIAKPLLSTGQFKSLIGEFTDVCKMFLEAGDDELDYCVELCSGLASVVQGVSDQKSNSVKSTAILEKELANTNLQLGEARKNQAQCQQSKENIDGFQVYLESLDKEIKLRHKAVRDAEAALDAAEWALNDLAQKLGSQRQSVLDATELLTGSQASVKDAKEEFEGIVKDEDLFLQQIERASESLVKLREDLTNLKKASEVILDIKKYVSATTLKMGYLMDIAVREPVRQIGLVEETDVWDYFSDQVATQQCSADFKQQLGDFHGYCTGPAMAGFEKVKKFVDLTPLCKLDDKTKIATEEDAAVQTRIGLLTDDLKEVQSWLDPFKGTDMTLAKEREKVEEGEPEGLRQVMGVYGKTNFYTEYLKEWKVKKKENFTSCWRS